MAEVTAYTFHVEDPARTGQTLTILKGTPRSDELDGLLGTDDGEGNVAVADHVYVDEDDQTARAGSLADGPQTFGEGTEGATTVATDGATTTEASGSTDPAAAPARNASRDTWASWMESMGQPVADTDTRDDLIAKAEAAGLLS